MSDKLKNLAVRTLSGVVLTVVMLGAILLSQESFRILFAGLLCVGMWEFYDLTARQGAKPQRLLGMVLGLILYELNFLVAKVGFHTLFPVGGPLLFTKVLIALLPLLVFLIFIVELYRKQEHPMANIASTLMGVLYVALPLGLLCYIPMIMGGGWNPYVMLFFLLIIWANDVFAYLVGISIGRHRLFERISPKKSWEGFFGGVAGALLMGFFAARVFDMEPWIWLGVAAITALTGVLGDLVESMFKRSADVKDSGSLIPGHGGILDRFDAMLVATPFVVIYLFFIFVV